MAALFVGDNELQKIIQVFKFIKITLNDEHLYTEPPAMASSLIFESFLMCTASNN